MILWRVSSSQLNTLRAPDGRTPRPRVVDGFLGWSPSDSIVLDGMEGNAFLLGDLGCSLAVQEVIGTLNVIGFN